MTKLKLLLATLAAALTFASAAHALNGDTACVIDPRTGLEVCGRVSAVI